MKCQRLEREKAALARRWASAQTEKKDAVEYLKLELLNKEDEAERLAERLQRGVQRERRDGELRERVRRLEEDNAGLGEISPKSSLPPFTSHSRLGHQQ